MIPFLFLLAGISADPANTALESIVRGAQGRVGAAAVILSASGETKVLSYNKSGRFPMQSVYKFPIGMAVLSAVDHGVLRLDQRVRVAKSELVPASLHSPVRDEHPRGDFDITIRELLRYTVSESDGTASDVCLRILGGPAKAQAFLNGLGIADVTIATSEMEMARDDQAQYRNWATPRGIVALLRAFYEGRGLSAASRDYLMQLMTQTTTGPNRLKGSLPPRTAVAHKTGTSGTVNGMTAATNDVGLITLPDGRMMAIAVFVSDSSADTTVREGVIAKIAQAAFTDGTASSKPPHR
jgi:beta-lactamase class A